MKKFTILTLLCALFTTAGAQESQQEITYVSDPSQGYLFNKFKDNWFVTGEVGGNIYFSVGDKERKWTDRFDPAASVYVGKWFSPIIGARIGVSWLQVKGLSSVPDVPGIDWRNPMVNGMYKQQFNHVGPVFDVMFNLTNWFCGYKPERKYNFVAYAGGGGYWTYARKFSADHKESYGYKNIDDRVLNFRFGIINSFNVSKQVQLSLDIRYTGLDNHPDEAGLRWNRTSHDLAAFVGVTYLFKKREWDAPVVPVCPEPENCDPLRAQLAAANNRIADLENQLAHCCEKCEVPEPEPIVEEQPLCTIYYPINIYKLTRKDVMLLEACAAVMKESPDKRYKLTGWADNYTGNNTINVRLRHNRVNGVAKQLKKLGVPESQLEVTIDNGNLCDLGEKYVALDRAVTIEEM